jgi:hypothetical protein
MADLHQPETDRAEWGSRRRWPRFHVDVPVFVTTERPTRAASWRGRGSDLGGGGLAVVAEMDLTLGDQVIVEFAPPYSAQPVGFRCWVRNCLGNRYGLEFITENDLDYVKTGELQVGLAMLTGSLSVKSQD